jgi:Kae1-associated kinase Bud32
MMRKVLARGAEALVYVDNGVLIKERISKSYRISALDKQLRTLRTRSEGKLLQKLTGLAPEVYEVDEQTLQIRMKFVDGQLIRPILNDLSSSEQASLMQEIGRCVGRLHEKDIIHGDLTTSNMIEKDGKVILIDFGLGFVSLKPEDKAVDLHVFRQALTSKHYWHADLCYASFLKGYSTWKGSSDVLKRLEKVEQRGRYKARIADL